MRLIVRRMPLRMNKALKYLIILLFSFEVLAPAFVQSYEEDTIESSNQKHYVDLTGSFDCLAHLFFEENNSEEREGKDYDSSSFYFIELFSVLEKFKPIEITWSIARDRVESQPSLYTLHRVLRI